MEPFIKKFLYFFRFLLGKGGSKLQELEKQTATKITIPKPGDSNDSIIINGNKEGIDKALHEIKLISDEQSKQAFEKLLVPKIYHPFVEGRDGAGNRNKRNFLPSHEYRVFLKDWEIVTDLFVIKVHDNHFQHK